MNYGVTFDMFAKVDVKGENACDLYKFLTSLDTKPEGAGKIGWNFEKFIVNRSGEVVARFGASTKPDSSEVVEIIDGELAKAAGTGRDAVQNTQPPPEVAAITPPGGEKTAIDFSRTVDRRGFDSLKWSVARQRRHPHVGDGYPYASDRHHLFMLEGTCDLQEQSRQRGITYAFPPGQMQPSGSALTRTLSASRCGDHGRDAGGTITELDRSTRVHREYPPFQRRYGLRCSHADRPLANDRAFEFRKATQPHYEERLHRPWQDAELHVVSPTPQVPFEPLCLSVHDLGQLVSECEIDHAIAPVPHTGGGSTAGYARWEKFKQHAIEAYAGLRNNPLIDGTSRLSPYLHYGMISPFRVAGEAAALRTPGRDKYLDELLIWPELAYAFCYYRRDHEPWRPCRIGGARHSQSTIQTAVR